MIRTQSARIRLPLDTLLFGAMLALIVVGLWMVFDASYAKNLDNIKMRNDAFHDVRKQAYGAAVGLIALLAMLRIGYWRLRRMAFPLMALGLIALVAVWFPHIGIRENNAFRWIGVGPIRFQPSELAKMTLIIYLAAILSRPDCNVRYLGGAGLGPPMFIAGLYLALIEREPDLGTAAVLFLGALTLFFMAGARKRHLVMICGGCALVVLVFGFAFGHRKHRIETFLHPERDKQGSGYQTMHSMIGVGSGGWLGAGLGEGKEKYFLPQANTDFIFATVAEELGFVRTVPILMLLCLVGWRGFRIARNTKDPFASLLAGGIAALISWQALINVAVATASIPATGVPLPFISYGSSSLVFLMAGVGILLNIAQHPTPPSSQGEIARMRGSGR